MRWHLTVALAILTVTAGCTSVTGFGDAPDEAVTPAPVPTAEPRDPIPPPGITDAGIRSVTTLSAAHRQALTNQSYTMHERYVGTLTRGNVTTTVRRNETTSVTGIRTYRHDLDRVRTFSDGRERIYRQSTYGDGQLWYERRDDGENRTFRGGEIRFGRDQFAFEGPSTSPSTCRPTRRGRPPSSGTERSSSASSAAAGSRPGPLCSARARCTAFRCSSIRRAWSTASTCGT
ncbi:hypothetical protein ACFQH8_10315 [Halomicroarcula sp. GCM10025710]